MPKGNRLLTRYLKKNCKTVVLASSELFNKFHGVTKSGLKLQSNLLILAFTCTC